jgi:hypothetical protein
MSKTEIFNSFVGTKISLRNALARYGHKITDRTFRWNVVSNLPAEFLPGQQAILLNSYTTDKSKLAGMFKGAGMPINFNDQAPREAPSARVVVEQANQVQGGGRFQSGGRGIGGNMRGPCWNCGIVVFQVIIELSALNCGLKLSHR